MSSRGSVFVEAPARLHFGVLDLRGQLGRSFGGLGAAISTPSLLLEVTHAGRLSAMGQDGERACEFAEQWLRHQGLTGGARFTIHRAIPGHSGLGSGTQLALSVARALSELHGVPAGPDDLARATGRGKRSAIGTWAFGLGGFIVEGGRRPGSDAIAPLLARFPMPQEWRYVLAVPHQGRGLSGEAEALAFEQLPPPPQAEVERVAHLVLVQLLPALVEADLPSFGAALSQVQRITGAWFAPQQGGIFAPGPTEHLIAVMAERGALGVGQSSWGPAAYGLVNGEAAAEKLADQVRGELGSRGEVFQGKFDSRGARVWTGPPGPDSD
jgi:beta-ribofuranosylaminobenzene 5'-phosphate synthase